MAWNVFADAKDFLHLCFKRQPKERPNALKLSQHKFITTEVPLRMCPESKPEPITAAAAAANSDHAHDEDTSSKLKLELNVDMPTDTKNLESSKHRFTGSVTEHCSLVCSL